MKLQGGAQAGRLVLDLKFVEYVTNGCVMEYALQWELS